MGLETFHFDFAIFVPHKRLEFPKIYCINYTHTHTLSLIATFSWLRHTKLQLQFTIAHVHFDWTRSSEAVINKLLN